MRKLTFSILAVLVVAAALLLAPATTLAQVRPNNTGGGTAIRPQIGMNINGGIGVGSGLAANPLARPSTYNPLATTSPFGQYAHYNLLSPASNNSTLLVQPFNSPLNKTAPRKTATRTVRPATMGGSGIYVRPSTFAPTDGLNANGNALGATISPYSIFAPKVAASTPAEETPLLNASLSVPPPLSTPPLVAPLRSSSTNGQSKAGTATTALMKVILPRADAQVWFQGAKTNRTGTEREFISPPLNDDGSYTYEIRARWEEKGEAREVTRTVRVRAGDRLTVDFTRKE